MGEKAMRLGELISDLPVEGLFADPDTQITGIAYDSRLVKPGDLFVAVEGFQSDGHRYIGSALEKGAAAVLCSHLDKEGIPAVVTKDTRRVLALVSARFFGFPAKEMTVIGVTGTNGKTTVTNLVKTALEKTRGIKVGLIGTNAILVGEKVLASSRTTPESRDLMEIFRRMADEGCKAVVMEVSSHALVLDRVSGVPFAVGAFTNLTEDHLDFHETMEEYARCKSLLFRQCGRAVINADDPWAGKMAAEASCPVLRTAVKAGGDLRAFGIRLASDHVSFDVCMGEKRVPVTLGIPGEFSVYNALTTLGILVSLGIDLEEAAKALAACHGVMGRAELVPTDRDYTVMIDYAHTPDALENILKTVRGYARGRVITLFGCGGDRDRKKRPLMGEIAARLSDLVIVTSDNPRTEEPMEIIREILPGLEGSDTPRVVIENRREAIAYALREGRKDDVILLAGKGHETYQEIDHVKTPFDERIIVAELLQKMKERKETRMEI